MSEFDNPDLAAAIARDVLAKPLTELFDDVPGEDEASILTPPLTTSEDSPDEGPLDQVKGLFVRTEVWEGAKPSVQIGLDPKHKEALEKEEKAIRRGSRFTNEEVRFYAAWNVGIRVQAKAGNTPPSAVSKGSERKILPQTKVLVRDAHKLRDAGFTHREIAEKLGKGISTIGEYLTIPEEPVNEDEVIDTRTSAEIDEEVYKAVINRLDKGQDLRIDEIAAEIGTNRRRVTNSTARLKKAERITDLKKLEAQRNVKFLTAELQKWLAQHPGEKPNMSAIASSASTVKLELKYATTVLTKAYRELTSN